MRTHFTIVLTLLSLSYIQAQGLRETVGQYCFFGSALNTKQCIGGSTSVNQIVDTHFNAAVAENCMKPESLQPTEGHFDFTEGDRFISYCQEHNLTPFGHVLIWHEQTPKWMFLDEDGNTASSDLLKERMRKYIMTVVGHFHGKVKGWDVVNEAVNDDGTLRQSPYYNILGEEFIELAFRYAHEADPDVELYYNDYSMSCPAKRATVCRLVRQLKAKGLRIDAVGMQSHNGMDYPVLADYEESIEAFAACGVKVMMTELDINVLPKPENFGGADITMDFRYDEKMNPYRNGLPADMVKAFTDRYMEFFRLYYKHRDKISRINFWGLTDADTWLNNWPIKGRTNYPLLFDRSHKAKPVVAEIIKLYKQ